MTDLTDLIERVAASTGPDREIDALIGAAFNPHGDGRVVYGKGRRFFKNAGRGRIPFHVGGGKGCSFGIIYQQIDYTRSIDAVVALIEKVMPDAKWQRIYSVGHPFMCVELPDFDQVMVHKTSTSAIALLLAFLRAYQEKA